MVVDIPPFFKRGVSTVSNHTGSLKERERPL